MNATLVWISICGIIIAVLCLMYAVYYWERKQIADNGDLEYLDEIAREHEQGIADNRKKLAWLIRMIENNHTPSATLVAHLDRVRRILRSSQQ
jgi:hypothetical protein